MLRRLIWAALAIGLSFPAAAQNALRPAIGTTITQLDPAKTTTGDEYIYIHLVFNELSRIDPDLVVRPDLAVSWKPSADLNTWTFKLWPGVKFDHGKILDADDVVATMTRILDPATGSRARANLDMVDKVEAVDPATVRFTLKFPYVGFADIFAERQLRILPKDREPVGTGPFMMKSWSPGDRMELAKFPDYFETGLPKLDAVTIRIIPEAAARLAALDSGAIEILWNLPYGAVEKYKSGGAVRVDSVATATWDGIVLNNSKPPFNDVRVRQALAATIDKAALVDLVLFGQGAPTLSPIPPSHPYFNKDVKIAPPDIERAKKLLAEAGFPNGFEVSMPVPFEREQRVRLGVVVRDMAKAAGIRINVERVPFASYTANVSGKAEMYVDGYFARPTIDTAIYPFYHSTGSWNRQLWLYKNERVDALLDTARTTNDEDKRRALFQAFQKVVDETVPGTIAYSALHANGLRREVQNFRSTPMQWLELKEVSIKR